MINFQALNVLLDTLRKPDPQPSPVARVAALRPTLRVAADSSAPSRQPAAAGASAPPATPGPPASAARAPAQAFPIAAPSTAAQRLARSLADARGAADVLLSSGGAELERALRGSGARVPDAPILRSAAPLLATAPPAAAVAVDDRVDVARVVQALGAALQTAVAQSGLFYESHLARWIAGDYPQAALEAEPQTTKVVATPAGSDAPAAAAPDDARHPALPGPAADAPASVAPDAGDAAPPLLRQQLDVLDTRQFAFVGEAWPGQRVAIRFEDERDDDAQSPLPTPGPYATRMAAHIILELPTLGTVGASVALHGGGVRLQITTDGPAATARLHAARAALAEALAARALPVAEIAVFDELG